VAEPAPGDPTIKRALAEGVPATVEERGHVDLIVCGAVAVNRVFRSRPRLASGCRSGPRWAPSSPSSNGLGGAPVVGAASTVPVIGILPIILIAVLFGLAMDYEVVDQSRLHQEAELEVGAAAAFA
jgi:hypothetical protein